MGQLSGDTWVIVIAMFVLLLGLGSVIGSMAPNDPINGVNSRFTIKLFFTSFGVLTS